jgi:putative addiction module component (TIGR02574 family)
MSSKTQTIEVDEVTADALRARAAERGVSVAQLLSDIAAESGPITVDPEEAAELDRRWAAIEAGEPTVPHDEVVRWLETWGTPAFRPWHKR